MFIRNEKRFNIYASQEIDGIRYASFVDPTVREQLAITEIADPVRESDETHYVQEIDDAPYIVNTPKSQEQLDKQFNAKVKAQIAAIEAGQARAVREAALGNTTFLAAIDAEIVALRATLLPEPPEQLP